MPGTSTAEAAIERWLYATLSGDATLAALATAGIYRNQPPVDALGSGRAVAFALNAAGGVPGGGGVEDLARDVYLVKAMSRVSPEDLDAAVYRVQQLLSGAQGTQDGWHIRSEREGAVSYDDIQGTSRTYHAGGLYRVWAS